MVNILFVERNTDGTVGGSHHSLLYLVQGLDRSKFGVTVVFYQENRMIGQFERAGCKVIVLARRRPIDVDRLLPCCGHQRPGRRAMRLVAKWPVKAMNYLRGFVLPIAQCFAILRRERIGIVHLNNTIMGPQEWIVASRVAGAHAVAHERGINEWFPRQIRFWAQRVDAIICISSAVRMNLMRQGFPHSMLRLIYNGLDANAFRPNRSRAAVLQELGIPGEAAVVGIVGNLKAWKGQETVIKATETLRGVYPDIRCLVVGGCATGEESYRASLEALVAERGLLGNVIITGPRSDVPDLIGCMSVLIHASIRPEPFGRVLLEGMALGKPVITTSIGAGPEIVVDGETGFVVPPGDEAALARAVSSLLENPERATVMGRAGLLRLQTHFHIAENVRRTTELYREVLGFAERGASRRGCDS